MSVNVNEKRYSHESLRKYVKSRLEQKILGSRTGTGTRTTVCVALLNTIIRYIRIRCV